MESTENYIGILKSAVQDSSNASIPQKEIGENERSRISCEDVANKPLIIKPDELTARNPPKRNKRLHFSVSKFVRKTRSQRNFKASATRPAPSYFRKLSEKVVRLSRKLIGVNYACFSVLILSYRTTAGM